MFQLVQGVVEHEFLEVEEELAVIGDDGDKPPPLLCLITQLLLIDQ
jgi:hypothetical protein